MVKALNAQLNPISHLLVLLGAHHILNVSRIRVKLNLMYVQVKNVLNVGLKVVWLRL